ncbi:hypothetical protein HOD30_00795 [Candidatus Peregrinibacteria bacterium]|jgi:hypothetical protein|nr:hypothetical protein [Candidatus Peregrinibacteria bacterium]MBT4631922.1 hypothetical protein [Candidatus Peregrinibacteria bacterium]MBT5516481.1 hypothetical protein [Candidatus Peregrinibacteria bacterium]MBT5824157.1 hypothetical protein [Candidatus Peregrinibacteria bacterium]
MKTETKTIKNEIKTFIKQGKLDDAMRATYEAIAARPEEQAFRDMLKLVDKHRDKQLNALMKEYFVKAIPTLKAEFKADKKKFRRV